MTQAVITGQPIGLRQKDNFEWAHSSTQGLELLDSINHFAINPMKLLHFDCCQLLEPKEWLVMSVNNSNADKTIQVTNEEIYYSMHEESTECDRCWCRWDRAFRVHVKDRSDQDVFLINHEYQSCGNCCYCSECCRGNAQRVSVTTPHGNELGIVAVEPAGCSSFIVNVYEHGFDSEPSLKIIGSSDVCFNNNCCGRDVEFKIENGGQQIGTITYRFVGHGLLGWSFSAPYLISLTGNATVNQKALLTAAAILLEYRYFDTQRDTRYPRLYPAY